MEATSLPSVPHFVQRTQVRRRRPTSTTTTTTTTTSTTVPSENSNPTRGRRPLRKRPTTVKYHNHRYPGDPAPEVTLAPLPSDGLKLITPPIFNPLVINEDLLGTENLKDEVFVDKEGEKIKGTNIMVGKGQKQYDISQTSTSSSIGIDVPDDLKGE